LGVSSSNLFQDKNQHSFHSPPLLNNNKNHHPFDINQAKKGELITFKEFELDPTGFFISFFRFIFLILTLSKFIIFSIFLIYRLFKSRIEIKKRE